MPKLPSIAEMALEIASKSKPKKKALPPLENAQRTQIIGTLPTYEKARRIFELNKAKGKAIDYGAGLGEGAKILKAHTYEPYPKDWTPTFTNPEEIPDEAYGKLTNLNVLNVVPREVRDEMVLDMGRVMRPKSHGIITTRGKDVMNAQGESGPEPMSMITSRDTYQKGFTPNELEEYLRYMLGDDYDINKLNLGSAGAMIQKKAGGGAVHMMKGGDPIKMALEQALKRSPVKVPKVKPDQIGNYNALPLRRKDLASRSASRSDEEIAKIAQRIADQQMGLHVTSGVQGDTKNRAGRSIRENERIKQTQYNLKPIGTVAEPVPFEPKKGMVIVGTTGDQTISDFNLVDVNGLPINSDQTGGGKYSMGQRHLADPKGWNSGVDPANMYQNKITDLALIEGVDPEQIYGMHMGMGRTANNFAQHYADANLKSIYSHLLNRGDYTPEDIGKLKENSGIKDLNKIIKNGFYDSQKQKQIEFKDFPGVENYEQAYQFMLDNPEARKWFNNRMKIPKLTSELGLPNGLDTEWAISEPALRNTEIGMSGLGTFRATPFRKPVPDPSYEMYGHYFPGVGIGPSEVLMPYEIAYPDATAHIMATQPSSSFSGTIQKVFPHQFVDDEYLRQYQSYKDAFDKAIKEGSYKDGGLAKGGTPEVSIEGVRYEPEGYTDPMGMTVPSQDDMKYELSKQNMSPMPYSEPYRDPITGAILERGMEALPPGFNTPMTGGMTPIDWDNLPEEEKRRTFGDYVSGVLEPTATVATGAGAFMAGLPIAFGKGLMGGDFNQSMEDIMRDYTYIPRSEQGLENLEMIGKGLEASKLPALMPELHGLEPIISLATKRGLQLGKKGIKETGKAVGEKAYNKTEDFLKSQGLMPAITPEMKPSVTIEPFSPKDEFGFYSKLEKETQKIQRKQGNGQAFKNDLLKLGVKPYELEQTGMDEFLKNNKSLTRDDVIGYAQRNRPEMKQTVLGNDAKFNIEHSGGHANQLYYDLIYKDDGSYPELYDAYNVTSDGNIFGNIFETNTNPPEYYVFSELADFTDGPFYKKSEAEDAIKNALKEQGIGPMSKHEQHFRTKGGENYREVLVQTPQKDITKGELLDDMARRLGAKNFESLPMEQRHEIARLAKGTPFISGHYEEFPNTMINMRMDDRVDVDGKKGTLLDELQSDWHQKGRNQGYQSKLPTNLDAGDLMSQYGDKLDYKQMAWLRDFSERWELADSDAVHEKMVDEYTNWLKLNKTKGAPDAPYKNNWYELGLKKAIQQSVERGDDRLYLSNGNTLADRYDLEKHFSNIDITRNPQGFELVAKTHSGQDVTEYMPHLKDLEDHVGKDMAEKIRDDFANKSGNMHSYSGLDLRIGGEGMRKYYDEKYPSYLKKFAKKYGGTFGETEIETAPAVFRLVDENGDLVHSSEFDTLKDAKRNIEGLKISGLIPQDTKIKEMKGEPKKVYYYEPSPEAKKKIKGGLPYKDGGMVKMAGGGESINLTPRRGTYPRVFPPLVGENEGDIRQYLMNASTQNISDPAYMMGTERIDVTPIETSENAKTMAGADAVTAGRYEHDKPSEFKINPSMSRRNNPNQVVSTLGHEGQHLQENKIKPFPINFNFMSDNSKRAQIERNFRENREYYPEFTGLSAYGESDKIPFEERMADLVGYESILPKGQRLVNTSFGKRVFNTPELAEYYESNARPLQPRAKPQADSALNKANSVLQGLGNKADEFKARINAGDSYADALYKTMSGSKFAEGGSVAEQELAKMREILGMNKPKDIADMTHNERLGREPVKLPYEPTKKSSARPTVGLEPIQRGGSRIPSTQLELYKKKGGNVSIDDMRLALMRKI